MMNSILRLFYKFIFKLSSTLCRGKSVWYKFRLAVGQTNSLGKLKLGENIKLNVPLRCDGLGKVEIEKNTTIGYKHAPRYGDGEVLVQARTENSVISIGENCVFSNNISVISNCSISIGTNCLIGNNVTIIDSDFHKIDPALRRGTGTVSPVKIGNNVWLGMMVVIQKGVCVGDNSVIGAASIVTHNIPANTVAVGTPAKVIRELRA